MSIMESADNRLKPQAIHREEAPMIYASSFRIMGTGNDFMLILQKPTPVRVDSVDQPDAAILDNVAVVTMSPQSLKDLKLLIDGQISAYEKAFGPLVTPYTKQLDAPSG